MKQKNYIAGEVRASQMEMGSGLDVTGKLSKDWDIENLRIVIGIDKDLSPEIYKMSTQHEPMEMPVPVKVKGVYIAESYRQFARSSGSSGR